MEMESREQAVDKIYKRRNRYEIPEYQREEVWGPAEKQLLIDTILKGWKLPKFYFLKTISTGYEVVDGQQRLAAIFDFLDGELELSPDSLQIRIRRHFPRSSPPRAVSNCPTEAIVGCSRGFDETKEVSF